MLFKLINCKTYTSRYFHFNCRAKKRSSVFFSSGPSIRKSRQPFPGCFCSCCSREPVSCFLYLLKNYSWFPVSKSLLLLRALQSGKSLSTDCANLRPPLLYTFSLPVQDLQRKSLATSCCFLQVLNSLPRDIKVATTWKPATCNPEN